MNIWEAQEQIMKNLIKAKKSNEELKFFYDESNNIRVFRNNDGKFNNEGQLNFILGGFFSTFDIKGNDLKDITNNLLLDKSNKELKFKNLTNKKRKNFYDKISNRNLESFLTYLIEHKELYVHFQVLNPFYYGIVDFIDEIVYKNTGRYFNNLDFEEYLFLLKNGLYHILLKKYDECSNLFWKYEFPSISKKNTIPFLEEIISLLNDVVVEKEYKRVKQEIITLCMRKKKQVQKSLSEFILHSEHEKKNTLLTNFSTVYQKNIFVYENSYHLFDEETEIKKLWKENGFWDSTIKERFEFADSKNDIRLQVSDCIAGLLSLLFDHLSKTSMDKLGREFNSLQDSLAITNLKNLKVLLERTEHFDSCLLWYNIAESDVAKFRYFYSYF